MYLVDILLHASNTEVCQSPAENDAFEVMSVSYIFTARLEEKHTAEDEVLQFLSAVIKQGWPARESQLQPAVRLYFPYKDELTVENGMVMKGHKTLKTMSTLTLFTKAIQVLKRPSEELEASSFGQQCQTTSPKSCSPKCATAPDFISKKNLFSFTQFETSHGIQSPQIFFD